MRGFDMKKYLTVFLILTYIMIMSAGCSYDGGGTLPGTPVNPQTDGQAVRQSEGSSDAPAEAPPDEPTGTTSAETVMNGAVAETPGNIPDPANAETKPRSEDNTPSVYFTTDISPEGLMAVYEALGAAPAGNIAIKVTTGEPPNSNYLRDELIGDFARFLDGTIVECNTAYGGSRASDAMHIQVAKDHGFYDMTSRGFDLQDAGGKSVSLPVAGGEVLTENFVGATFHDYDYYVVLSHFKGHGMAGYGGAIKNISIGLGSSEGKNWIHSGGTSRTSMRGGDQDAFLRSMAEAGLSVVDALDGNILYINVMNRLSVDCDCNGRPAEPDMHDIGILASFDPVALDRACVDLVEAAPDGASLMKRINSRNGTLTIDHGAKIGLGSLEYELVRIDD